MHEVHKHLIRIFREAKLQVCSLPREKTFEAHEHYEAIRVELKNAKRQVLPSVERKR